MDVYTKFETLLIYEINNYANLRPIDKRRKRAVYILIHCAEGISLYRQKTYWPCTFYDEIAPLLLSFIDERKSHDFALSTINRDIYTLNYFSEYLQRSGIKDIKAITPSTIQGFMKWLASQKNLPTLKSATATLRAFLKYLYKNGSISHDYSCADCDDYNFMKSVGSASYPFCSAKRQL